MKVYIKFLVLERCSHCPDHIDECDEGHGCATYIGCGVKKLEIYGANYKADFPDFCPLKEPEKYMKCEENFNIHKEIENKLIQTFEV